MVELAHAGSLALLVAIAGTQVEALRRGDAAAAVNAAVALAAALLPALLEFASRAAGGAHVSFGPGVTLWIAGAGLLHSLGMLGLYESVWWWDHLTHTVSAAFVAAACYAAFVAAGDAGGPLGPVPDPGAATVGFTVLVGVFWELVELLAREVGERYGVEPVLVHYGWRDTGLDLVFDAVGALAVVALDVRLFVPVAEQFPGLARTLVTWGAGGAAAGSVLLAVVVGVAGLDRR